MSRFVSVCSVTGPFRSSNEDLIVVDDEIGLYAVVDAGTSLRDDWPPSLASHVEALLRGTFRARARGGDLDGNDVVAAAAEFAVAIAAFVAADRDANGYAFSMTALVWPHFQTRAWLLQCGHTQAFHVDINGAVSLAPPHTLARAIERERGIREARNHPQRHVIVRSFGNDPDVKADVVEFAPGRASVVLVSDGVHVDLDDEPVPLSVLVSLTLRSQQPANDLCAEALRRGSRDNASVVVVRSSPGRA